MIKLHYALIGRGYKSALRIGNQIFKLDEPMKAIYQGKTSYVIGNDEETCLAKIRPLLKSKYEGIKVLKTEEIK